MLEIGLGNPIQTPVQKPDFSELGRSIRQNLIKHIIVAVADKLIGDRLWFWLWSFEKMHFGVPQIAKTHV